MSRINLDPLMTLPDGSQLVISTICSRDGDFSCVLYSAVVEPDARAAFRVLSNHMAAATCLGAQEHAYTHAVRLYPRAAAMIKKPPYLIWAGPQTPSRQDW